jgi:hypothetical protein
MEAGLGVEDDWDLIETRRVGGRTWVVSRRVH